jgi:hypothetical protein
LVRVAKHWKGPVDSGTQPDARLGANPCLQNPSNIVNAALDKSSKRPTRSHARKKGKRDLFWVLILYLITVIGTLVASGIYLLS